MQITVRFEDGRQVECARHSDVGSLIPAGAAAGAMPCIGALVNNEVVSLSYRLDVNCTVRLLTMADPHGWRIYEQSLSFLLAKTVRELFPDRKFSLDYSIGPGLYCGFEENGHGRAITVDEVARIRDRMREHVRRNVRVYREKLSFDEAVCMLEQSGQTDKLSLLRFRNSPKIHMYRCEEFWDFAYGPVVANVGILRYFDIIPHPPGFVLLLPGKGSPTEVAPFKEQPLLFQIFREHKEWGRILGVNTVGRLNEVIAGAGISEFIKISEALHEKKVARIADQICAASRRPRVILISGPSSAGKTTFAKRLAIQLRVNGLRPHAISLDNYFFEIDRTPRDEEGKPDFEHLGALDLELFNRNLLDLMAGKPVDLPVFNFQTKRREFRGAPFQIADDQILIVEGIHGLNPGLTPLVPADQKFRIYVSALTQLGIDSNNRISTTDNRLLRRLVRDNKYRKNSALVTLQMWPSVRRGEERWVFPYQNEADAMFNSALDYEIAVLKPMVEPLLMEVKPGQPEYAEARRLQAFMTHFLEIADREVPSTSILREYIGRSSFHY